MEIKKGRFERIYQRADGSYLPDTSQPDPTVGFAITDEQYTPHQSTRYMNVIIGSNGKAKMKNKNGVLTDCDQDLPELYTDRSRCFGCSACYAICPAGAIAMRPDEEGFFYPVVDAQKCSRCRQCMSVCIYE